MRSSMQALEEETGQVNSHEGIGFKAFVST